MIRHPIDIDSRDMALLVPEFRRRVEEAIERARARGVTMVVYATVRGPLVEARHYCVSRSWNDVGLMAKTMQDEGATWLADLLRAEDCWRGKLPRPAWRSNAPPGQSWHSWGEAVDAAVEKPDGKLAWNADHPGYEVWAQSAEAAGLVSGHRWRQRDSVHVQMRPVGAPRRDWANIERELAKRFSV